MKPTTLKMFTGKGRFILMMVIVCFAFNEASLAQKSPSSEADLKKQADKKFSNEDYVNAMPFYSQLLSLYPKNPDYNYRYGVCLLQSSKDKSAAVSYLENATKSPKIDEDVYFYLGKAYMLKSSFNEALGSFENFKKKAGPVRSKKMEVDLLEANCRNAKELSKNHRDVVIINQQQVARNSFSGAYVLDSSCGKLLTTPERFLSSKDKDKMVNPLMFLTLDGQSIYYASYGKGGDKGKDLYCITKMPSGSWGEPVSMGNVINTSEDEDYPFLDRDGVTLYFCSKGHNSVGGYDIFKSSFDRASNEWSEPENIGIPINTPDDDIYYVPGASGEYAQYSSSVESDFTKIGVRKIKLGAVLNQLAVITGQYISEDQPQRRDAKISVIRIKDNGLVTTVRTDPRNGKYELNVPPGDDYTLVVEAGGYLAHAENFSVADGLLLTELKQKVELGKTSDAERMTLSNYFTAMEKISGQSIATVSSDPTNVTSNEYRLKDADTSKLQPVEIKGRTVYVTPPKNIIASRQGGETHALFEQNVNVPAKQDSKDISASAKSNVASDKHEEVKAENKSGASKNDETLALANETKKENTTPAVVEKTNHGSEAQNQDVKKENSPKKEKEENNPGQNVSPKKEKDKSKGKTEKVKPANNLVKQDRSGMTSAEETGKATDEKKISDNVSSKELISIAYHDAASRREEAEAVSKDADMSRQLAVEQDSVAKSQIVEAKSLLKEGGAENKERAKLLLKESESNDKMASARFKKAKELDDEAKQLNSEADESIKEAEKLATISKKENSKTASVKEKKKESSPVKDNESDVAENNTSSNHASGEIQESSKAKADDATASLVKPNETASDKQSVKYPVENKNIEVPTTDKKAVDAGKNSEREDSHSGAVAYSSAKEPANDEVKKETTELPAVKTSKEESTAENKGAHSTALASVDKVIPVGPEPAKKSYIEHRRLLSESKELAEQADNYQKKIDNMPSSHQRDSLIARSNDMNMLSIKKWQQSQEKLSEAKQSDPEVEAKMKEFEKTEQPVAMHNEVNTGSGNQKQTQNTEAKNSSSKKDAVASNTTPKRPVVEMVSGKSGNMNNAGESKIAEAPIDTASPVYPEYKATTTQVKIKQAETINVFADALKLNKLAQEKKAEEISIRDKAVVMKDSKEKSDLLKKADAIKHEADSLTASSTEKFKAAQQITGEVASLNDKATKLKTQMAADQPKRVETAEVSKDHLENKTEKPAITGSENITASTVPVKTIAEKNAAKPEVKMETGDQHVKQNSEPTEMVADHENKTAQPVIEKSDTPVKETSEQVTASAEHKDKTVESPGKNETTSETLKQNSEPKADLAENKNVSSPEKKDNAVVKTHETISPAKSIAQPETKTAISKQPSSTKSPLFPEASVAKSETKINEIEKPLKSEKQVEKKLLADAGPMPDKITPSIPDEVLETHVENSFSIPKTPLYNESNPIPMNPGLPEGLVFKVQIGAFHSPLPAATFKKLQPVSGETTRPGWIRYCVGLFKAFEAANLLKSEMKTIGYKDAFVVAYYNGKRISLSEAYSMISRSGTEEKKLYASNTKKETSHLLSLNITAPKLNAPKDEDADSFYGTSSSPSSKENSGIVEYAVQVGVYKSSRVPNALVSLVPLHAEPTRSGLHRFMTGRYSLYASADSSKRIAIRSGVKDAFIVAYRNGSQLSLSQARAFAKTENIRNDASTVPVQVATSVSHSAPSLQPTGQVIYKVQLGAFRQQLSEEAFGKFKNLSSAEISQEKTERGLTIIYAGSFTDLATALSVKNDIVARGLKDAFVTSFSNGKKVSLVRSRK